MDLTNFDHLFSHPRQVLCSVNNYKQWFVEFEIVTWPPLSRVKTKVLLTVSSANEVALCLHYWTAVRPCSQEKDIERIAPSCRLAQKSAFHYIMNSPSQIDSRALPTRACFLRPFPDPSIISLFDLLDWPGPKTLKTLELQ